MTQKELSTKVLLDTARILEAAEMWPGDAGETWRGKLNYMESELNGRKESWMIDMIDMILSNWKALPISRFFSKEFVKSDKRLLMIRAAAESPAEPDSLAGMIDAMADESIAAACTRLGLDRATVLSYMTFQAFEHDQYALAERISDELGEEVDVSIEYLDDPAELREKDCYCGKTCWREEPLMPVITVTVMG